MTIFRNVQYIDAVRELVGGRVAGLRKGPLSELRFYDNQSLPTESEIQAKIAELEAAEPLRLLRLERNRLLQETDWEVQRNTERNITDSNLIDYRNALRDLPQEIENGNIPAPTLDENGVLVFDDWPTRGEQNA